MSEMGRERFEDLKEAYALGALSESERRELEGYLTLHPELRPEVKDLSSVANTLAFSTAEYDPPSELRRNLMDVVNSEARQGQTAQPSMASRLRGYLSLRTLAPAALALITVVLLGWNVLLQSEVGNLQGELQERQTFEMQGSGAASDTSAEVVELEGGRSIVTAEDMPTTPEGKTMQIWVIRDGTPQPAGTFRPGSGPIATAIEGSLDTAEAVAITVEPTGGSEQPTTEPVLQTSIPT
jgi:anti-sigma-K factor RskA